MKKYFIILGRILPLLYINYSNATDLDGMGLGPTKRQKTSELEIEQSPQSNQLLMKKMYNALVLSENIKKIDREALFRNKEIKSLDDIEVSGYLTITRHQRLECPAQLLEHITNRINQGSVIAKTLLGYMYFYGLGGLSQDFANAAFYYREAADQGDSRAQSNLGYMYSCGLGELPKDLEQAFFWYQKAAIQGDAASQLELGRMYYLGLEGVTKNHKEAVFWLEKAAVQGNARAQFELGRMYEHGQGGLTKNHNEAVFWLEKAAAQDHAASQLELGRMYYLGLEGLTKNHNEAVFWLEKAAAQDHAHACYLLGCMYERGEGGLAKNHKEAVFWFEKAAAQGHAASQSELGRMYYLGLGGLTINHKEAVFWFEKAVVQEHAHAHYLLGCMYERGEGGLSVDLNKSAALYYKAALGNIKVAKVKIKSLFNIIQTAPQEEFLNEDNQVEIEEFKSKLESMRDYYFYFSAFIQNTEFKDAIGNYHLLHLLAEDALSLIKNYLDVLAYIKEPGFMITCIQAKSDQISLYGEKIEKNDDLPNFQFYHILEGPLPETWPFKQDNIIQIQNKIHMKLDNVINNINEYSQSFVGLLSRLLKFSNPDLLETYIDGMLTLMENYKSDPNFPFLSDFLNRFKKIELFEERQLFLKKMLSVMEKHSENREGHFDFSKQLDDRVFDLLKKTVPYRNYSFLKIFKNLELDPQ